jgi:dihydroxyacetone kinase
VKATEAAAEARRAVSGNVYAEAAAVAATMPGASLREIAAALNEQGLTTANGYQWVASSVSRMLKATGR